MSSTENEDLIQKYSSLRELYENVLKEKQVAVEETERATISFARHFDSEVTCDLCCTLEDANSPIRITSY